MVRVPLHQLVPRDSARDRLSRVLQAESRIVGASANVTPAAASACAPIVIAATAAPIAVNADVNAYQLVPIAAGRALRKLLRKEDTSVGGTVQLGWVLWLQRMLPLTAASATAAGMLQALPRAQDEHMATAVQLERLRRLR